VIFVTVGSTHFDALIRRVDEDRAAGRIADEVVMQIGYGGQYRPHAAADYFRILPSLRRHYEQADLIVGHGGTGTTLEVLALGKPLVSVANPALQDNHQVEFLEALEELGLVTYCRDLAQLPSAIAAAKARAQTATTRTRLADDLDARLSTLRTRDRGTPDRWIRRLGERLLRSVTVRPERVRPEPER
jgi:beta-1,4-N-acetylglucosaminyltransferase